MKLFRHIGLVLLLALSWCEPLWSAAKILEPVTTTEGREFFVAWLPNGGSDQASTDLKLQLVINSRRDNQIRVEYCKAGVDPIDVTVPGGTSKIITLDIASVYWDPANNEEETVLDKGVRVYSTNDERFTLYSTNQIGAADVFSFDGAHILPVEALGTEYMIQTADGDRTATEFVVMSTKPGETHVTIKLTVNSRVANSQNLDFTFTKAKQIYIVRSKSHDPEDLSAFIDLSGSTICADQPIAVWSGNQDGLVPYQDLTTDHAYDQLLPLDKWGTSFIVPMTACKSQLNIVRVVALQAGTNMTVWRGTTKETEKTMGSGETFLQRMVQDKDNPAPQNVARYIKADKPIQVYLYSSSSGANTWYDETGGMHLPSDPSMTIIPPLEYMTDTTIFSTYTGGDGKLNHQLNIWAFTSQTDAIKLDGNPITTGWKTIPGNDTYSQNTYTITAGTHILTAPTKCFSGYAYGISDGQAYMYPVGYDFTPKQDSLFLADDAGSYDVRMSEWKADFLGKNPDKGGWYLDKELLDDNTYLLDSTYVCDSTELTFPIKTYRAWSKTRWEIEGTIQGTGYFKPFEQISDTIAHPKLTHLFHLLPIEQNSEPFEDFEVRGIVFHKPIICDIPEEKWERDTFNTIVRVLRKYNDTTWHAMCIGDTLKFFYDSLYSQGDLSKYDATTKDSTRFIATKSGAVNPNKWQYNIGLGDHAFQRHYTSVGGCDSLSTIMLFVCDRYFESVDTVVCYNDLQYLNYGRFFERYSKNNSWPMPKNDIDTVLYDTLYATACMDSPEFEPFKKHCKDFHGCDSVLKLHLTIKKIINNFTRENLCLSNFKTYTWKEKVSGREIRSFSADTMELGQTYTYTEFVKYVECEGCKKEGCDSVRNILQLTFLDDNGQIHPPIHVCLGSEYYYNYMNVSYTYKTTGKPCNKPDTVVNEVEVRGVVDGQSVILCSFDDSVIYIIDTMYTDQRTIDTVCYDPNIPNQTWTWGDNTHPHTAIDPIPIRANSPELIRRTDYLKTKHTGCDSICELYLYVGQPFLKEERLDLCDNSSLIWQDTLYYGINYKGTLPDNGKKRLVTASIDTRRDTISRFKCDSVYKLHIDLHPTYGAIPDKYSICENQTYDFYGTIYQWPASAEPHELTIPDQTKIYGCDSSVTHLVTVYPVYLDEWEPNDTVCQTADEYYEWVGHPDGTKQSIAEAGIYELVDNMKTLSGCNCDSIVHRKLVVLPSYTIDSVHMMSNEDTLQWIVNYPDHTEKRIYAGELAEFDTPAGWTVINVNDYLKVSDPLSTKPVGSYSCDSIRNLTVKVGRVFRDTTYDATCSNCGTYEWVIQSPITGENTIIYIEPEDLPKPYEQRIYYDSLKTSLGYDSIYVRYLTVYPSYYFDNMDAGEICQGEVFNWDGHMAGDNGITHRLFVDGQAVTTIPTGNDGVVYVTDSMRTDTIYTDPNGKVKKMYCDSVHVLTLMVHKTYNDRYWELTEPQNMSSNDTLVYFTQPKTLFVGYDFDYTAQGVSKEDFEARYERVIYIQREEGNYHRDSVQNLSQFLCDSVHYVDLNICSMKYTEYHDSIADNDSTWFFGGDITPYGGVRQHTLPLVKGQDFHYDENGNLIDYSQATGRTERQYLLIDTMRTADNCDSIIHNHLHIFPSYRFEFDTTICSNVRWDWRDRTYVNRYRTGYYYDSINYKIGRQVFDSVFVLGLVVEPSDYWEYDTTLCMNDTMYWHTKKVYYRQGGLKWIEVTYDNDPDARCGTIYHMNLAFKPFYGSGLIDKDTICQFEPYQWISPGETNPHTERLYNEYGLKIDSIPTDVYGDFIYFDSLQTKDCGCDSIYTLYLHINRAFRQVEYDTICHNDSLLWRYHNFKDMNIGDTIVRDSFLTYPEGCDSIYEMRLHVYSDFLEEIYDTICADEHFVWKSVHDSIVEHLSPGTHFLHDSLQTLSGCDSVFHLYLTVLDTTYEVHYDTICIGDTLHVLDHIYRETGNYKDTTLNEDGCHHFIYTYLTVIPPTVPTVWADSICSHEAVFEIHYTYTSHSPIAFSVFFDSLAHEMGFEDMIDVPVTEYSDPMVIAVPTPLRDNDRTKYPRPDVYHFTLMLDNGICQRPMEDCINDTSFIMNYPSWLLVQQYNDVIALLDSGYNGGYVWTDYQWYQGDSMLVGQTKPYLHIPTGLELNAAYSVYLKRRGEEEVYRTCPIIAAGIENPYAPTMGYLAVTPTCVVTGHPYVTILSRNKSGTYRISTVDAHLVSEGVFRGDATQVEVPTIEGMYIFQLWSEETPEEPYRAIKILVSEQCPNCDISSF
ncbi:MAG: IgGFc-binding protein [Paludibacteraceae bacterium]|nr:IgGFc-binding protein [Paludibacteraceae bacterium]